MAVITAEPLAFAVTLPLSETVATERLDVDHATVPLPETVAPSWRVEPFLRVTVRAVILPSAVSIVASEEDFEVLEEVAGYVNFTPW